jgi:hypothetical protein
MYETATVYCPSTLQNPVHFRFVLENPQTSHQNGKINKYIPYNVSFLKLVSQMYVLELENTLIDRC